VSPYGLLHDSARHVQLFLDRDLRDAARISFHPNINTATIVTTFAGFHRFLESCGVTPRYVDAGASESTSSSA
jgi:Ala-tRNA(Pro) deacylase